MNLSSDAASPLPAIVGNFADSRAERAAASNAPSLEVGDDATLLRRIQEGDKEALGELFDRHASLVHRIGLRILKDAGEADDLVQEVFLFLFRKSALFNPTKGSARSWLVQVTYCRAFDRLDYLATQPHYHQSTVEDCVGSIGANGHILGSAELSYWNWYLRKSFEELSDGQKQTLTLYFFEGASLLEISEKLAESVVNVRHHLYRGLERLRKRMLQAGRSGRPRV